MPKFTSKYSELVLVDKAHKERFYFHGGQFETDNPREVSFIRKHPWFNKFISEVEDVLIPKRGSRKED